jgi:hypothetical protein
MAVWAIAPGGVRRYAQTAPRATGRDAALTGGFAPRPVAPSSESSKQNRFNRLMGERRGAGQRRPYTPPLGISICVPREGTAFLPKSTKASNEEGRLNWDCRELSLLEGRTVPSGATAKCIRAMVSSA